MFATDVVVAKLRPFLKNQSYYPAGAGRVLKRVRQRFDRAGDRPRSSERLPPCPSLARCHIEGEECFFNRSAAVLDESERKMLNTNSVMLKS
jgi:hypothetical protein